MSCLTESWRKEEKKNFIAFSEAVDSTTQLPNFSFCKENTGCFSPFNFESWENSLWSPRVFFKINCYISDGEITRAEIRYKKVLMRMLWILLTPQEGKKPIGKTEAKTAFSEGHPCWRWARIPVSVRMHSERLPSRFVPKFLARYSLPDFHSFKSQKQHNTLHMQPQEKDSRFASHSSLMKGA